MEKTAPGRAASGRAAKCLKARVAASPEFCMPTSMEIVRATLSSRPTARPTR